MKKFLLVMAFGLAITQAATAQHRPGRPGRPGHGPGPGSQSNPYLIQAAERLKMEALRLEQAILYGRFHPQVLHAARNLTRQSDDITDCLRSGGRRPGFGGRIDIGGGRIDVEIGGGRFGRLCAFEIQQADQAMTNVERSLYGIPFHSPVLAQLNRTRTALQQVIASQPGPGPGPGPQPLPHLVARGEMNRLPFSFQASQTQTIVNLCVEFGRSRRIYNVNSLFVNNRWLDVRMVSLEQACRMVAAEAR